MAYNDDITVEIEGCKQKAQKGCCKKEIEIGSYMVDSTKIVSFCRIIYIFNFAKLITLVEFSVLQINRRNVKART